MRFLASVSPISLTLAVATLCAAAPRAQGNDARELSSPADGWWLVFDSHYSNLESIVRQGFRVVDIQVTKWHDQNTAVLVKNTGVYKDSRPGFCRACGSLEVLRKGLIDSDRRPISIEVETGWAAASVDNSGQNKRNWALQVFDTVAEIDRWVTQGNWRILDIDGYGSFGKKKYVVAAVENTGDMKRTWLAAINQTEAAIRATQARGGWSPYQLCRNEWGTYNCVFLKDPKRFWWSFDISKDALIADYTKNGSRVVSLTQFSAGSRGDRYCVILNNNKNALSTKVHSQIQKETSNSFGFLFRKIGGSRLAWFREGVPFEVESTQRVLHDYRSIDWINKTNDSLSTSIPLPGSLNGSCPSSKTTEQHSFETALIRAMRHGDTRAIQGLRQRIGGQTALQATAKSLGMEATVVGHTIGCRSAATIPNLMSLADGERLFRSVENGALAPRTAKFYTATQTALNEFPPKSWVDNGPKLSLMIENEGKKLAYATGRIGAFQNAVKLTMISGRGDSVVRSRSFVARLALPFVVDGKLQYTSYFVGMAGQGNDNPAVMETAMAAGARCLIEGELVAAMKTWKDFGLGTFTTLGKSPCIGSNDKQPWNSPAGTPIIGNLVNYTLSNGIPNGITLFTLGLSKTQWGLLPLPMALEPFGAKDCTIYTEPTLQTAYVIGIDGTRAVGLQIPKQANLIGLHFYTQFWSLDKAANALGMTYSTAIDTGIGG